MQGLIGFTGAGGVGKTTTAQELLKNLPNAQLAPSISRGVFAKWGLTEKEIGKLSVEDTIRMQFDMFRAKLDQDKGLLADGGLWICDRTPLDHFAYCSYRCAAGLTQKQLEEFWDLTKNGLTAYKYIMRFPLVTFPSSDDGFRDTSFGVRNMIDTIIHYSLIMSRVDYLTVPVIPVTMRAAFILSRL